MDNTQQHIGFIGGSGRSGTTILKRILAQHPDVTSVPECRIMIDPGGLLDFRQSVIQQWSPFLYDQRLRQLTTVLESAGRSTRLSEYGSAVMRMAGIRNWPINILPKDYGIALGHYDPQYESRVANLIQVLSQYSYQGQYTGQSFGERARIRFADADFIKELSQKLGSFYSEMTHSICDHGNAQFFVDDNTWNILYFDQIRSLVPDAKLIHIVRDPRDVIASFTQQTWAPSDPIQAAHFYRSIMERWNSVSAQLPEQWYRVIRLEDLVSSPKSVVQEICDFWGLRWSDHLLDLPLNKAHSGRWKDDLSSDKQDKIQEIIEPFLTQFNYD